MSLTDGDKTEVRKIVHEEIAVHPRFDQYDRDITELKSSVRRLEVLHERTDEKIDGLVESVQTVIEIIQDFKPKIKTIAEHDTDIKLLKSVVADHSLQLEKLQQK